MDLNNAFGTRTHNEFNDALQRFVDGCRAITARYFDQQKFTWEPDAYEIEWLQKRVRVVRGGVGSRSVHCFVDMATGDVLKPAGWKAPAKHARGNIYDAANGLKGMGPHGPAYLR